MARRIPILSVALFLAFGLVHTAQGQSAEKAKAPMGAKAGAGGKVVLMAADELKWVEPKDSPPGVKMAVVWGDPEKGAHGAMHRFPGGFSVPTHFHTAAHDVIVVSGTMELTPEGGTAKKLGPGSYFSFGPKKKHSTTCVAGADCTVYVDCMGKWDVVMPDAAKTAKK
ncbi:MAG: DUF4437 domain-containing protein [Thermoanaerobaculia bacterium]